MLKNKRAKLFTNLSAFKASPNALRKEKHEQFTPMEDVNLHHLFSYVKIWRIFECRETRTKSKYIMSCQKLQLSRINGTKLL